MKNLSVLFGGSAVTFSKLGAWGQFGNQLFQISAVLGYAERHGCEPVLPPWFCKVSGIDYSRLFPGIARYRGKLKAPVYAEPSFTYRPIPKTKALDLRGNFQSELYFENVKQEIKALFREPDNIAKTLDAYCRTHGLIDFDAVHFRFYAHPVTDIGQGPMEALPDRLYRRAIDELKADGPLVVATDNKSLFREYCRKNPIDRPVHLLTFQDPLLDFYLLSRAKRLAISNSSFSWWAAYLGREKVTTLAPHRYYWFDKKTRHDPFWDTSTLYPEHFRELIF